MSPYTPQDVANASHEARKRLEKKARDLAKDYIYFKLSKGGYANCKEATLLRRLGREIEQRHELLLKNMCEKLDIDEQSAERTFKEIADETFATGVNWGRIVVLYTFAGKMAVFSTEHHMELTDRIVTWLGDYVTGLSDWILKEGGWVSESYVSCLVVSEWTSQIFSA